MHAASMHSYFYDWDVAMVHANALAYHERKRHRVERREDNTLFRFEVIRTDIDIIASDDSLAA